MVPINFLFIFKAEGKQTLHRSAIVGLTMNDTLESAWERSLTYLGSTSTLR